MRLATGAKLIATVAVLALGVAGPALARDALGIYDGWGAFRDDRPRRCYAIAQPVRGSGGKWRPFASVAHWPDRGLRSQFYARLSRPKQPGARVTLTIDTQRFELVAGGADAWAANRQGDAAIVAAMRTARSMSVESVAATGGGFADAYALRGAATAIDAAALGCARRG